VKPNLGGEEPTGQTVLLREEERHLADTIGVPEPNRDALFGEQDPQPAADPMFLCRVEQSFV
jgi:hypothetical protein